MWAAGSPSHSPGRHAASGGVLGAAGAVTATDCTGAFVATRFTLWTPAHILLAWLALSGMLEVRL